MNKIFISLKRFMFILFVGLFCIILCYIFSFEVSAESTGVTQQNDTSDESELKPEYNILDIDVTLSRTKYKTVGPVRNPVVTVKDSNGILLKNGTDYIVSYDRGRIKPGKYNVAVTFMGKYSGSKTLSFIIKGNSGKVNKTGKWSYKYKKVKGKKVRIKTAYRFNDGTYPVGATKIGKKYYYFKGTKGKLAISSKKHKLYSSDGLKFDVTQNGTLKKGWQVVKGKLYYFGGTYNSAVKNKKVDGIKLASNGVAKNNLDSRIKKEAITLLESITDRDASKETQLKAVYEYMISHNNLSYQTKNPDIQDKNWVKKSAYNMLTTHSGSCSGFAAMFTVMAHEIGYKKTYVYYGRVHGSRDQAADGFTRHAVSYIDGYIYDTEGKFAGWMDDGWKLSSYITFIQVKKYRYK